MALSGLIDPLLRDKDKASFAELWPELLDWPPDLFAFTAWILEETGLYKHIVSPLEGGMWPPGYKNSADWHADLRAHRDAWRHALESDDEPLETTVDWFDARRQAMERLLARATVHDVTWDEICALHELHAIADEACDGFGVVGSSSRSSGMIELEAELNLTEHSTLATFSAKVVRILPKLRTPQSGLTLRSLSHQVCALRNTMGVSWLAPGNLRGDSSANRKEMRILLYPWPLIVEPAAFRPATAAPKLGMGPGFGFFDFAPTVPFDAERVRALLGAATSDGSVQGLVLPEAALTADEHRALVELARTAGIAFVLCGVREPGENYSVLTFPRYDMKTRQDKHHRWNLDRSQIEQYGISAQLKPSMRWWENISIPWRSIGFTGLSEWLTFCHVICEDLARLDPVEQVIRAVGPTLLIALLQDGPQLIKRWSCRYASVYADDPGCSVLTLTSLGMCVRSRYGDADPDRTVALWSEPGRGSTPLILADGKEAILLSLKAEWIEEYAADGRSDGQSASVLRYVDHRCL